MVGRRHSVFALIHCNEEQPPARGHVYFLNNNNYYCNAALVFHNTKVISIRCGKTEASRVDKWISEVGEHQSKLTCTYLGRAHFNYRETMITGARALARVCMTCWTTTHIIRHTSWQDRSLSHRLHTLTDGSSFFIDNYFCFKQFFV